jgi:DNA-binding NarL/FixJ family response regulator
MKAPTSRPAPITLVIVEDDAPTRETLVTLLATEERFRCLGAYASAEDALGAFRRHAPEVALVDINLPGMNGIECVARIKALAPATAVLMLTTYEDSDRIFRSLRAGAKGYLLKRLIDVDLITAIEQVHDGGSPMSMPVARKVVAYFQSQTQATSTSPSKPILAQLTAREREVLELLATGCLYKHMGERLGMSFSTVRTHLRHIYEKLHVGSRTEATVKYLEGR